MNDFIEIYEHGVNDKRWNEIYNHKRYTKATINTSINLRQSNIF